MMPVIRISDKTWERMKKYARPLEDLPDDVIGLALDALEERGLPAPPKGADLKQRALAGVTNSLRRNFAFRCWKRYATSGVNPL